ncbi:IclR family transcriptional regulator domain-containing protein [Amycolatopsis sp. NBC_01480]|uniref:IclR family transcriptional regulator domain-containing protein n=1 Tax=Amycolatopsis sp. NBC_01480 TaxID=2903562 RepID=UPI002E2B107F|nr:IclR family transcriptional regulator C-terminal domain-containing protein [Amycolatopsis sp. NBC_01480]
MTANSVLGKVQLILEAFGPEDEHLSLTELARRSGVAKAPVHRLAQELLSWGVLEHGAAATTGSASGCSRPPSGSRGSASCAPPPARTWKTSARPRTRRSTSPSRVAGRMPMHCTATGKVQLAHGPRALVDEVLASPLERLTPHTVSTPGLMLHELTRARANGYAVEYEQTRVGFVSVAIPLTGATGLTTGALAAR